MAGPLRLADSLGALFIAAIGGTVFVALLVARPLLFMVWRIRSGSKASPHRLLIVGYTTYDDAAAKGLMRDHNLWYNPGRSFQRVVVYIPVAAAAKRFSIDERILYIQDGAMLGAVAPHLGRTNAAVGILRGWLHALVIVLRFRIDVIQVNGPNIAAVIAAFPRLAVGTPCVMFIEAFWEEILSSQDYMSPLVSRLLSLAYPVWYRLFDAFTGAPSFRPNWYLEHGMRRDRIWPYVHNIDTAAIAALADTKDTPCWMPKTDRRHIISVSRLNLEKRVNDLPELLNQLKNQNLPVDLVLVGDGPLRDELVAMGARKGLGADFVLAGFRPNAEVLAAMAAADVVFAAYTGSAMVEAMAVGRPIVAFDNETHRIFLTDGETGLLVPDGDVPAAAAAIRRVLENKALAQDLGSKARSWALAQFSPEAIVAAWLTPFQAVHLRRPRPSAAGNA